MIPRHWQFIGPQCSIVLQQSSSTYPRPPPAVQTMNNDCYLNQVDIYITLKECENLTQIRDFPCSKQPLNLL